jgi:RNA polymerase sigma-70 factor (ECF subfamily)
VEDVAQEAALGLLGALPTFQMQCTVAHFATRIGVHTALSARRRLKVRREGHHIELDETHASSGLSPADVLLSAYRRQMLRELCDELPGAQSEALVLHCVMGMSLEEVAAVTASPKNTVRSRLRLAKESLRQRISSDGRLRETFGREGVR